MTHAAIKAIAIGGSAGALSGLSAILKDIPADFVPPIFITVHLPADRSNVFAQVLQAKCRILIHEAEDKEPIHAGNAYVAPPDYHLLIEKAGTLALSSDEPVLFSRPSIDVMFESAADAYGTALLAIVLSGASSDGANGLKAVVNAGGMAIVEDPSHAYSRGMPDAALSACSEARAFSLDQLAAFLKCL
jgi:two-component system, chemotaxis family, protein-glutamate methylesterase/glutaminase